MIPDESTDADSVGMHAGKIHDCGEGVLLYASTRSNSFFRFPIPQSKHLHDGVLYVGRMKTNAGLLRLLDKCGDNPTAAYRNALMERVFQANARRWSLPPSERSDFVGTMQLRLRTMAAIWFKHVQKKTVHDWVREIREGSSSDDADKEADCPPTKKEARAASTDQLEKPNVPAEARAYEFDYEANAPYCVRVDDPSNQRHLGNYITCALPAADAPGEEMHKGEFHDGSSAWIPITNSEVRIRCDLSINATIRSGWTPAWTSEQSQTKNTVSVWQQLNSSLMLQVKLQSKTLFCVRILVLEPSAELPHDESGRSLHIPNDAPCIQTAMKVSEPSLQYDCQGSMSIKDLKQKKDQSIESLKVERRKEVLQRKHAAADEQKLLMKRPATAVEPRETVERSIM